MAPSSKVLVDTDVLINFLRRKAEAQSLLESAVQTADLFCSVITLAEILAGMRPSEREATEALIAGLTLVPVTEPIARRAGTLRRQVVPRWALLADCLIAATAVEEECALLTGNRKDYPFGELIFYPTGP